MGNVLQTFAQILDAERQRRHWTMYQVQKSTQITASYLNRIMRGEERPPPPDKVLVIATAMECDPLPLLTASVAERGRVELAVDEARAGAAARLVLTWPKIGAHELAVLELALDSMRESG